MKNLKHLLLVLLLFIGVRNIYAYNFDNTIKLYDYANVLTDNDQEKLKEAIDKYIDKYNIDMAIVTVKYYNYSTLKEYMNEFYNRNNFGIDYDKSGIIAVLDLKNNDIGMETFGKAKSLYNDIEIKNLLFIAKNKSKYYDKLSSVIKYSDIYASQDITTVTSDRVIKSINWLLIIIISILVPSIVVIIELFKLKEEKISNDKIHYIRDNSVIINKREEKFLTTHTKQINK